jgi:hypothetical protein
LAFFLGVGEVKIKLKSKNRMNEISKVCKNLKSFIALGDGKSALALLHYL